MGTGVWWLWALTGPSWSSIRLLLSVLGESYPNVWLRYPLWSWPGKACWSQSLWMFNNLRVIKASRLGYPHHCTHVSALTQHGQFRQLHQGKKKRPQGSRISAFFNSYDKLSKTTPSQEQSGRWGWCSTQHLPLGRRYPKGSSAPGLHKASWLSQVRPRPRM